MTEPSRKILIVQNIDREGPGLILEVLKESSIPFDKVDLYAGAPLPDPTTYAGLIVLGGPQSANDSSQEMLQLLHSLGIALDNNLPCLGICLGLQTLVKAGGGTVMATEIPEIGFRNPLGELFSVELTPEGKADPLFAGLPASLPVFQLHGETVAPPAHATLLGTGKFCRHQILRIGKRAYGFQCHFELTEKTLMRMVQEDPDLQRLDPTRLLADFRSLGQDYTRTGMTICRNFLHLAGLA